MSRCIPTRQQAQRGAALLIMLVIMVIGIASILVGSLNSAALNNTRQQQTSAALAQAKEALIGRAATDITLPGSLPCPDQITNIVGTNVPDDGIADLLVGNDCPSYIGLLPWKTLGLSDLRDAQGERLWYALSPNFRDDNSNHINSDTVGTLDITGTQTTNNNVAIIFSAGPPLTGDSRSTTKTAVCNSLNGTTLSGTAVPESWCAANYLDSNNAMASTAATPNTNYQAGAPSNNLINDQLLLITREQLLQPVEMRIAREAKACLDNYAASNGQRYPWAVPVQNWYLSGVNNTRFGRIPYQKPINNNKIQDFLAALDSLQSQVNACITNNNNGNALDNAGKTLEDAAKDLRNAQPTTPPLSTAVTSPGKQAGDKAQNNNMCDTINGNPSNNSVQTNLNATLTALASELANEIATNNSDQAVRCDALFQTPYWQDWKYLVFYQVDDAYQPGVGGSGAGASMRINGIGNYRAAVIAARSPIGTQVRNPSMPSSYLEGANVHNNPTPSNAFTTNSIGDTNFKTVNDLVLCLDARVNCK